MEQSHDAPAVIGSRMDSDARCRPWYRPAPCSQVAERRGSVAGMTVITEISDTAYAGSRDQGLPWSD